MLKFLSALLIPAIISASMYYDAGFSNLENTYLAGICECNHGSKFEKHVSKNNPDDFILSKDNVNSDTHLNKLPDCHTAKSEKHLCMCKKSSKAKSGQGFAKQIFCLAYSKVFPNVIIDKGFTAEYRVRLRDGFDPLFLIPPES